MNVRTAQGLYDFITNETAWRKKELITLKILHDAQRNHQQEMLRRAGIALLYAHWEGFAKSAGTAYVEFVARQGKRYNQLADNFVALAARGKLKPFTESDKADALCDVAAFFCSGLEEKARIIWDGAIRTKSNLSAARTRSIIRLLGLDYAPFEISAVGVIDRLLELRNGIAHGRMVAVTAEEFSRLHSDVLRLVDELADQICDAALTGAYLKGA